MNEIKPVRLAKIKERAEAVSDWDNMHDAWLDTEEDSGCAVVGHDASGELYPLAFIDCGQYDQPEESIKLAEFYAAANPKAVLELVAALEAQVSANEQLHHEVMKLQAENRKLQWEKDNVHRLSLKANEALKAENAAQAKRIAELEVSATRYEKLRRLNAHQFQNIFKKNITSCARFDELVDNLSA